MSNFSKKIKTYIGEELWEISIGWLGFLIFAGLLTVLSLTVLKLTR